MNLLHITPYYPPAYAFGGVVRAVHGMATALAARGHSVTVLTTDALDRDRRIESPLDTFIDDVRVVRVRNASVWLRGRANLSTPLSMKKAVGPLIAAADLVHFHEFRTAETLLLAPQAARHGLPLVLSPHGTLTTETGRGSLKRLWDIAFSPRLARCFSAVVALTAAERAEAEAFWKRLGTPATFSVVPNGVNPAEFIDRDGARAAFRARWGLSDAPVCLFLGRLHARKGIDFLIRAFQIARLEQAYLVIAGPDEGMLATITPLIAADRRIVLTGYLDDEGRRAALAAADVFVLPALGEGLSIAALEALASGLPAILSPECNLPEAAAAGAALIVERQVEPLASALTTLMSNPELRAAMGERARALVSEHFTWDRVGTQLETVYQSLVKRQHTLG